MDPTSASKTSALSCTRASPSSRSTSPPGPPLAPEMVEAIKRSQDEGGMHGLGLSVDDCQKTYEELSAKSVEFIQPVETALRDRGAVP